MIRILTAVTAELPGVEEMRASLPKTWVAAFDAAHKTARRESLGGLWILWRAGVLGDLFYDDRGRPGLMGSTANDISVSHTGRAVFCALASGKHRRVGIDAEERGRLTSDHMVKIAKRFYAPDEEGELLSAKDAEAVFLRLWTRREAYAKFCGDGLASHTGEAIPDGKLCFASGELVGAFVSLCADAPIPEVVFAPEFVTFFGKDA